MKYGLLLWLMHHCVFIYEFKMSLTLQQTIVIQYTFTEISSNWKVNLHKQEVHAVRYNFVLTCESKFENWAHNKIGGLKYNELFFRMSLKNEPHFALLTTLLYQYIQATSRRLARSTNIWTY